MRGVRGVQLFLGNDELRGTLQTAAAVLIAYGIMAISGLEDGSWAVFSALFVVQATVGGTIGNALWRTVGALTGAAIAVALILVLPDTGWHTIAALLIGVTVMSVFSIRLPELSYGLVTVTIIAITPDLQVVEGALSKVTAIAIGSFSAILACILVLPVSANRRADAKVAEAIKLCGHAIADCLNCTANRQLRKDHEAEYEVALRLRDAHLVWRQARLENVPGQFPRPYSRCSQRLLEHTQRLQENLALVERISDDPLSAEMSEQHKERLNALGAAIEQRLNAISLALTQRNPACIETARVWEHYRKFADEADHSAKRAADPKERDHIVAIKWACRIILKNIEALQSEVALAQPQ